MIMDRIALILAIVGGLNWGSIGLFHIDDVDYMVSFILEEDGLLACAIGSAEPALEPSSSL